MRIYIIRRILIAIPTLVGASLLIFLILRVLPGNVLAVMFGGGAQGGEGIQLIDPKGIEKLLADLNLDKPLYVQYGYWMRDIVRGRLGESFFRGQSVGKMIMQRGPVTLQIGIMSVILSWLVGLPVGILSATKQDTLPDYAGRIFVIIFLAAPAFWVASLIVLGLVILLEWFPPMTYVHIWKDPKTNLLMTWAPATVLGLGQTAMIARMARSSMLEVMREDYVRTARAKGLKERLVMWRHAVRNALLPVITLSSVMMGFVLGGSVAVEKAFNINGLGLTLVRAVIDRDFNVVQNLVLVYAVVFVFINLAVDLMYAWIDPRIRYE